MTMLTNIKTCPKYSLSIWDMDSRCKMIENVIHFAIHGDNLIYILEKEDKSDGNETELFNIPIKNIKHLIPSIQPLKNSTVWVIYFQDNDENYDLIDIFHDKQSAISWWESTVEYKAHHRELSENIEAKKRYILREWEIK